MRDALVAAAWQRSRTDAGDDAAWAALEALAAIEPAAARAPMEETLADRDWAMRLRAARWCARRTRPATRCRDPAGAGARGGRPVRRATLITPTFSPQVYIDTAKGTVQVELAVLDAPLTVENFVALARRGYFDGLPIHRVVPAFVVQDGDPRGDGSGGPGYSIRDELSDRPYARGTVGMALSGPDTGGSQWFVTLAPQPHLEGRTRCSARSSQGMDVVDQLEVGDTITRVRVWDGVTAPQQQRSDMSDAGCRAVATRSKAATVRAFRHPEMAPLRDFEKGRGGAAPPAILRSADTAYRFLAAFLLPASSRRPSLPCDLFPPFVRVPSSFSGSSRVLRSESLAACSVPSALWPDAPDDRRSRRVGCGSASCVAPHGCLTGALDAFHARARVVRASTTASSRSS